MAKNKNTVVESVETTKEIDAPYELPEEWKWCRLGELCSTFTDGDWIESKDQASDGIRLIQTGNIGNGIFRDKEDKYHYISQVTFEKLNCTEIYAGDILISRLPEPVGRSCIIPQNTYRMITAVDCTIIRLNEKITSKGWFCLYTQSPIYNDLVHSACTGTTRQRISRSKLGNIAIPLPPTLEEQQRIVNRIETLFAKLDKAKEKAQNVVDTFETRKASILHKAFTGELTKKWRAENGVSYNLIKSKFSEICTKITDGFHNSPKPVVNGYPYIMAGDIKDGGINFNNGLFMDEKNHNELYKKASPSRGDILIVNIGAGTGKAAIIDVDFEFSFKNCAILKLKRDIVNPMYVYQFFLSEKNNILINITRGGAQPFLSLKMINDMEISYPSLPEQTELVRILDTILEKETKAKEAAEAVLEQIDLLKKSILAHAFRGEL